MLPADPVCLAITWLPVSDGVCSCTPMVKSTGIKEASFQFMDFMVEDGIMRSGTTGIATVLLLVAIQATADVTTSFLAVDREAILAVDINVIL
jgi:hypothetical protein